MHTTMPALPEEKERLLSRICRNCGENFGRHKSEAGQCPIVEDRRTVAYSSSECFDEWIEEATTNATVTT